MRALLITVLLSTCASAQPLVNQYEVNHKADCGPLNSVSAWVQAEFASKDKADEYLTDKANAAPSGACPHHVHKLVDLKTQTKTVIVDPSTSAEFLPPTRCVEFCEAEWERAGIPPYPFRAPNALSRERLQLLVPWPDRAMGRRAGDDLYALRSAGGR